MAAEFLDQIDGFAPGAISRVESDPSS